MQTVHSQLFLEAMFDFSQKNNLLSSFSPDLVSITELYPVLIWCV